MERVIKIEDKSYTLVSRTCKAKRCEAKMWVLESSWQWYCCQMCAGIELPFITFPVGISSGIKYHSVNEVEQSDEE